MFAPLDPLQVIVAFERNDLGVRRQINRRNLLDAPDQIPRHGLGQPGRSDEHVNAASVLRQEDCSLTRRVAAADDDHLLAAAQLRLHERRGVVDACPFERREVVE